MQPTRHDAHTDALLDFAGFAILALLIAGLSLGAMHSLRRSLSPYQEAAPSPYSFEQYIPRYPYDYGVPMPPTYDERYEDPGAPQRMRTLPRLDAHARPRSPVAWPIMPATCSLAAA